MDLKTILRLPNQFKKIIKLCDIEKKFRQDDLQTDITKFENDGTLSIYFPLNSIDWKIISSDVGCEGNSTENVLFCTRRPYTLPNWYPVPNTTKLYTTIIKSVQKLEHYFQTLLQR